LERFKLHNHTLGLHKTPQQEFKPHNAALGPWGRCGRPDSGEDSSGDGLRRVGEESMVHKGSIWVLVRGGRPWAAAGAGAQASLRFGPGQHTSVGAPNGRREGMSRFGWRRRGPEDGACRVGYPWHSGSGLGSGAMRATCYLFRRGTLGRSHNHHARQPQESRHGHREVAT
jgi:hypothetical protein